jgi:hypothetical protein
MFVGRVSHVHIQKSNVAVFGWGFNKAMNQTRQTAATQIRHKRTVKQSNAKAWLLIWKPAVEIAE